MKDDKFDLEGELRAGRPRPREEFATALAGEVRGAVGRARQSRFGLMLALTGLVVVAVASFGGVGYASSQPKTAAEAQYGAFTPKAKVKTQAKAKSPTTTKVKVAGQVKSTTVAPKAKSGQLPFTGLALWIPLAAGLVLIVFGVTLRMKGRRRGSTAH